MIDTSVSKFVSRFVDVPTGVLLKIKIKGIAAWASIKWVPLWPFLTLGKIGIKCRLLASASQEPEELALSTQQLDVLWAELPCPLFCRSGQSPSQERISTCRGCHVSTWSERRETESCIAEKKGSRWMLIGCRVANVFLKIKIQNQLHNLRIGRSSSSQMFAVSILKFCNLPGIVSHHRCCAFTGRPPFRHSSALSSRNWGLGIVTPLWPRKYGYGLKLDTPIIGWLINVNNVNTKNRLKSVVVPRVFKFDPYPYSNLSHRYHDWME